MKKGAFIKRVFALIMTVTLATGFVPLDLIGTKEVYAAGFNMGKINHWAEESMRKLYDLGLLSGDTNGNMNPDKNITRAEFVSLINRAFGYKQTGSKTPFTDVKGTEWYAQDINIAYTQGYFSGDGKSSANATGNLSREQAVTLLGRNLHIEEDAQLTGKFTDEQTIQNWSRGYINTASDKNIVSGYSNGEFRPSANITRAEAAAMVSNALGTLISTPGERTLGYVNGNVTLSTSNVTLKDTVITGDLYITEGVGLGHVVFDNVTVWGDVIVSGSGESYAGNSSVTFKDSTVINLITAGNSTKTKTIKIQGKSIVNNATIKANTFLEELANRDGGFSNVVLNGAEGTRLDLAGDFDKVTIEGYKNYLSINDGTVNEVIVDEKGQESTVFIEKDSFIDTLYLDTQATISGTGDIGYVKVNADGVVIFGLPNDVEIRPGLTASVNGKNIGSSEATALSNSPNFASGYPKMDDIGSTAVYSLFKTNKPGTVYWGVTLEENGRLSSEELIKPSKFPKYTIKNGNLKTETSKEATLTINGLKTETEYILSAVFVDEKGDESERRTIRFTTSDSGKLSFLSGYPILRTATDSSITIEAIATTDCNLYWALYEKGKTAPNKENLRKQTLNGQLKNNTISDVKKNTSKTITLSGLHEKTTYDFYVMLASGATETAIVKMQISTKDLTSPVFNVGYPKGEMTNLTAMELQYMVNEDSSVYYAAYLSGTTFPVVPNGSLEAPLITSEAAKKQIVTGMSAQKSGSNKSAKAGVEGKFAVSGLAENEDYDVYFVAQDAEGNYSEIKKVVISALPAFLSSYPMIGETGDKTADILLSTTKDAIGYWAVLPTGSVAPTQTSLKSQVVAGALEFGTIKDLKKNIVKTLVVEGLEEKKTYDFYMVLTENDVKFSTITKLSFSTSDKTPPAFITSYPRVDKVAEKAIDILYKVDEAGTLYYSFMKKGTSFPVPVPPSIEKPELNSEETKIQVMNGTNAIKSGRVTIKEDTEAKLSISGLLAETAYDGYFVLVDANGNKSDVLKMDVKTLDVMPPTASVQFDKVVEGDPTTDSAIKIIFNEEVYDTDSFVSITGETFTKNVQIYDMSAVRETQIEIKSAQVELYDGYTIITLPSGSIDMKNGNRYQFELNRITDTSNNRMSEKTRLPIFTTVAPMVNLVKTTAPANLDMTFEIDPQESNTPDEVLYDIIFESNETIEFELYKKNSSGEFALVTNSSYVPFVTKDGGITLSYIYRRDGNLDEYKYEVFNSIGKSEYGIRIKSISGNSIRGSWSSTVRINIKNVIGSKTNLDMIAGDPVGRFEAAIQEGVIQVNYPKAFEMIVSFTDTVIPSYWTGYPILDADNNPSNGYSQIGDTLIRPLVRTDKEATMYYLVAPKGVVSNPTAFEIMNATLKPTGGVNGNYQILSAGTEFEVLIQGLEPQKEYELYSVLKGTPQQPSQVYHNEFKTAKMDPPVVKQAYTINKAESSAEIFIELDKGATVDWIVYNKTSAPAAVTADTIRNRQETGDYKPIDFGTSVATVASGDASAKSNIVVSNLERNAYYNFYAVASSPLGGGDSIIIKVEDITPADRTPPSIGKIITSLSNGAVSNAGKPYSGTVTISFTEPLYYIEKEGDDLKPLTLKAFSDALQYAGYDTTDEGFSVDGASTFKITEYATARANGVSSLSSVTIKFTKVYHKASIIFPHLISDSSTNIAGRLVLIFQDGEVTGSTRPLSEWEGSFQRENY